MRKTIPVTGHIVTESIMITGGILGICVVAIIQLIGNDKLDALLRFALYCFVIAIPLLAFAIIQI